MGLIGCPPIVVVDVLGRFIKPVMFHAEFIIKAENRVVDTTEELSTDFSTQGHDVFQCEVIVLEPVDLIVKFLLQIVRQLTDEFRVGKQHFPEFPAKQSDQFVRRDVKRE